MKTKALESIGKIMGDTEFSSQTTLQKIVNHPMFNVIIFFAVVCNSVFVAIIGTDYKSYGGVADDINFVFCAIFILELILRITASNIFVFLSNKWRILDLIVVSECILFVVLRILAAFDVPGTHQRSYIISGKLSYLHQK